MNGLLVTNWWSVVLRGLLGIAIGIVTFSSPVSTLSALVLLFGAYAFIDGVLSVVGAVRTARSGERRGVLLLKGIAGIAAGFIAFTWPALTATVLALVIAGWAIVTGILEIAAAVRLRKEIRGEWLLGLFGVLSIAFGILIAMAPLAGALVVATWVGAYAFVSGIILLMLGFRLRKLMHRASQWEQPKAA